MKMQRSDRLVSGLIPVDLAAGTVVGEYVIERKLDEGGMATVYGAVHPLIGKRAAIKVMSAAMSADAEQVQRFVQEARAVNAIGCSVPVGSRQKRRGESGWLSASA